MRTHLDGISFGIAEALRILNSDIQGLNGEITVLYKNEGILTSEIKQCEQEIAQLDTDQLIKVSEDNTDNPYFFFKPLQQQILSVVSDFPIDEVRSILGDRNCTWANLTQMEGDRKQASRTVKSYFCGGIAGTLTAFVKSEVKNKQKITKLREIFLLKQANLSDVKLRLKTKELEASTKGSEVAKFKARATFAGEISGRLNSESMPLREYLKTRILTAKLSHSPEELVSLYCQALKIAYTPLKD